MFCERIFGPLLSWQCKCGLFRHTEPIKYTCICPICGAENTTNQVRRYRVGYIHLNTPIVHIWYLHELLPYILNVPINILEALLYYTMLIDNTKKVSLSLHPYKKLTITQLIFASNYFQYLLQQLNILNQILKMKVLLHYNNNTTFTRRKYIIKSINLLNLCLLNNIAPQ